MARVLRFKVGRPANWEQALEEYLIYKQAQGLRKITLKGHGDVIGLFFRRYPEAYDEANLKMSLCERQSKS